MWLMIPFPPQKSGAQAEAEERLKDWVEAGGGVQRQDGLGGEEGGRSPGILDLWAESEPRSLPLRAVRLGSCCLITPVDCS